MIAGIQVSKKVALWSVKIQKFRNGISMMRVARAFHMRGTRSVWRAKKVLYIELKTDKTRKILDLLIKLLIFSCRLMSALIAFRMSLRFV